MSDPKSEAVPRFAQAQQDRSVHHPNLITCEQCMPTRSEHSFVVAADTQLGMLRQSLCWEVEAAYSRAAVDAINRLKPDFVCVCGDLVEMTASLYTGRTKNSSDCRWTEEECDAVQAQQDKQFREIWSKLDPDVALVCLCGNHDVGNRPTKATIERFKRNYGDDYLSFWANGTFNIVLNSNLFSDPTNGVQDLYQEQLVWLRKRLVYARAQHAKCIFVFSHHPWFLYSEDEDELSSFSPYIKDWGEGQIPDNYFHIPPKYRAAALELFREFQVDAAFCGHFHQNVLSEASFGMKMIITSSLSVVLDSTGNHTKEPQRQGFRLVTIRHDLKGNEASTFDHKFLPLES